MKFSWKICFSTIFISLLVFSIGGYVLFSALFASTYQRELANAAEENRICQYSFLAYWNTTVQEFSLNEENVRNAAQTQTRGSGAGKLRIRISNQEKEVWFDNAGTEPDAGLLDSVNAASRGQMLRKTDVGYEIQTASRIELERGEFLYLETIRDVTEIFAEREEQFRIYRWWMAGLLLTEGLGCTLMAVWLLRPLRQLSRATRKLAKGELQVRARVHSSDEFGELAADFNRMADSLEQQFQKLENANRRQEDFIGSFAHELKTPLTSMIGYADMLRTQEMSQEEQFQAANYIFKEGKRLEALSFKLLELLVIRRQELEQRRVNIKYLAEDIRGLLQPSLQKAGIVLKVIVEEEILLLEPDLMKTVLLNLCDNGRKAMEGPGTLYLLGRREEEGYAVYVRDTGKGIPKEELTRITEAFYMVDKSRARQQGGAGLGLSICAEIVKRHGGTLTFKSREGKGTMARIYLPKEVIA